MQSCRCKALGAWVCALNFNRTLVIKFFVCMHVYMYIGRFELSCTVDETRMHTVRCEGIGGVINGSEVACVYDSGPMQEKC